MADNVLILAYSLYMVQYLWHTVVEQAKSDKELYYQETEVLWDAVVCVVERLKG